uniref:ras-related protein Rab-37 isoform X4 n=1 Tax=Callithrix jacchus TaxID=9483 RepID=UPI0023DD291D|nr:ras-related protein Rab-37 isoform X4 [Callithrix jacchus]
MWPTPTEPGRCCSGRPSSLGANSAALRTLGEQPAPAGGVEGAAGRREEPAGSWSREGRSGRGSSCALPRLRAGRAHLSSGDMTGTAGATATRDEEAPKRSPPCSPSYDLTGKNKLVTVDGMRVKLQIWDTAGQERFRSVTHAYYRDAQALLLLYDITNKASFDNIRAWLTEIHEYAQRDVVIMLLGNKADMSSERVIRSEDGETLARVSDCLWDRVKGGGSRRLTLRTHFPGQEYGVPFLETSAKTGMNVELAFLAIAKELKYRAGQSADEPSFQIRDYVESQKKRSSCCSFV